jgi:hypothetical protein
MNKKSLFAALICICLVVSLTYYLNTLLSSSSSSNRKSDLESSTPGNTLKLQSLTAAMAQSGLSSSESGVSFLVAEAGFCAYGNFGQQVNLTKASEAFRGLEYQNTDYIIGSVSIPGYTESEDAHVYVHKTGWIVSYYTKTELVAKIIKDLMSPNDNKIEDAIAVVSSELSLAEPTLSYYDFRYPTANVLMVVGDQLPGSYLGLFNNTFRVLVPSEIAGNVSEFEWYHRFVALNGYNEHPSTKFGMHNQVISYVGSGQVAYGQITLVPSSKPDELVQPMDLKLDTLTVAWVQGDVYVAANGGFIILLHYD